MPVECDGHIDDDLLNRILVFAAALIVESFPATWPRAMTTVGPTSIANSSARFMCVLNRVALTQRHIERDPPVDTLGSPEGNRVGSPRAITARSTDAASDEPYLNEVRQGWERWSLVTTSGVLTSQRAESRGGPVKPRIPSRLLAKERLSWRTRAFRSTRWRAALTADTAILFKR